MLREIDRPMDHQVCTLVVSDRVLSGMPTLSRSLFESLPVSTIKLRVKPHSSRQRADVSLHWTTVPFRMFIAASR